MDANIDFVQAYSYPVTDPSSFTDFTIADNGRLYACGYHDGTVDFDPGAGELLYTQNLYRDGFVMEIDLTDGLGWAIHIGNLYTYFNNLDTDPSGNILVTGNFESATDFDPGVDEFILTPTNWYDACVLKLDPDGNFIWAVDFGGSNDDFGSNLVVDDLGYIYTAGTFKGTVDFNPGAGINSLTAQEEQDLFIQKMDPDGQYSWAVSFANGPEYVNFWDMNVDQSGMIYTTGYVNGWTDFDPSAEINQEVGPEFISKLSQGPCSYISFDIDSMANTTCATPGFASTVINGATLPVTYSWDTEAEITTEDAEFEGPGIYNVVATDANGCENTTGVIITGPQYISNYELDAYLISASNQSGFQTIVTLDAFNDGCVSLGGQVKMVPDELTTFISSNPAPVNIVGDTLIWDFLPMAFDSAHFISSIVLEVSELAVIGDTLCHYLSISPVTEDLEPGNNTKYMCWPVVNAYDPNVKDVHPLGQCAARYVVDTEPLVYTVQFQNTGNVPAVNIAVEDTLSTDLDMSTLRILASSHPVLPLVTGTNLARFEFNNIMLPDSNANEVDSHGYIIFEIKPFTGNVGEVVITNKAHIYFDFNEAIITNETWNTSVAVIPDCVIGIPDREDKSNLLVFPNPATDEIFIMNTEPGTNIKILDQRGMLIHESMVRGNPTTLITSQFAPGVYHIIVTGPYSVETIKILIY
jgi:hypothetical protein